MDLLTHQDKGSALTHEEMDGNLLSIEEELNAKAPDSHVGTGGTAHQLATSESHGFMSSQDKQSLDAVPSNISAAITALVDSSPDVLNTLREIAGALGNDPDFASKVIGSLNSKANRVNLVIGTGTASV